MNGEPQRSAGWLNRNVLGAGLTSFLADACYETATSVLPAFLAALGGASAGAVLGLIEGLADAVSSFVKLASGWWGDRFGHRKAIVVGGYALTAVATACFAFAFAWPVILLGRTAAWLGKGLRGPLRNAILAESVAPADRGKVFGFHRAGDTLGAIVGPLLGAWLLSLLPPSDDPTAPYRTVFLLTLIPGLGSALTFALLVREGARSEGRPRKFWASVAALPADFRRYLVGVGVFGAGDFSHTLLILAAAQGLAPIHGAQRAAALAALLYAVRNVAHAAAAFPIGALGDRLGRRGLLVAGYVLGALTLLGFAGALATGVDWPLLGLLFVLAGVYLSVEESLEPALTADLVPDVSLRGTAYGVLGTVNGLGDFVSSAAVGVLLAWGPLPAFAVPAAVMFLGALVLARR